MGCRVCRGIHALPAAFGGLCGARRSGCRCGRGCVRRPWQGRPFSLRQRLFGVGFLAGFRFAFEEAGTAARIAAGKNCAACGGIRACAAQRALFDALVIGDRLRFNAGCGVYHRGFRALRAQADDAANGKLVGIFELVEGNQLAGIHVVRPGDAIERVAALDGVIRFACWRARSVSAAPFDGGGNVADAGGQCQRGRSDEGKAGKAVAGAAQAGMYGVCGV